MLFNRTTFLLQEGTAMINWTGLHSIHTGHNEVPHAGDIFKKIHNCVKEIEFSAIMFLMGRS